MPRIHPSRAPSMDALAVLFEYRHGRPTACTGGMPDAVEDGSQSVSPSRRLTIVTAVHGVRGTAGQVTTRPAGDRLRRMSAGARVSPRPRRGDHPAGPTTSTTGRVTSPDQVTAPIPAK